MIRLGFSIFCIYIVLGVQPAAAQWQLNGVPAWTKSNASGWPIVLSEGIEGTIVVWEHEDDSAGGADITAQRFDRLGNKLWGADGIAVASASGDEPLADAVSDGQGGVIVAWTREAGNGNVFVQWYDAAGVPRFAGYGLAVANTAATEEAQALSLLNGDTFAVAWTTNAAGDDDVYVQKYNISGSAQWIAGGRLVCNATNDQRNVVMKPDGTNGVILAWEDVRNGTAYNMYGQRVGQNGVPVWLANGALLMGVSLIDTQRNAQIVPIGDGGAIFAWERETFSGGTILHANQRSATGVEEWGLGPYNLDSSSDLILHTRAVSDGVGGAIIVWSVQTGSDWDIYGTRIQSDGITLWGGALLNTTDLELQPSLAPDGNSGALLTWQNYNSSDIYARRIDGTGASLWASDVPVCSTPEWQQGASPSRGACGDFYVGWNDSRANDIYAQRIENEDGEWGMLRALNVVVSDVPTDAGGWVQLDWDASPREAFPGPPVSAYCVYRAPSANGPWTAIGCIGASGLANYSSIVTTPADYVTYYFRVDAEYPPTSAYYTGKTASGFSFPNLSPPPGNMQASQIGNYVKLTWLPPDPIQPGFDHYNIFRRALNGTGPTAGLETVASDDPSAASGPWVKIGESPTELFWDQNIVHGTDYEWTCTSVDTAGEESALAEPDTLTDTATGVGDTPSLPGLKIMQNHPNPFTASTELRFSLPTAADVRLEVFDVKGRRVAEQAIGRREAGWQSAVFNGRELASGVYFVKLSAAGQSSVRKIVIHR